MRHYSYEFEEIPVEGKGMFPVKALASGTVLITYTIEDRRPVIVTVSDLADVVLVFDGDGTCIEVDNDDAETLLVLAEQIFNKLDHDHISDEIRAWEDLL